jgi:hypothetical protein
MNSVVLPIDYEIGIHRTDFAMHCGVSDPVLLSEFSARESREMYLRTVGSVNDKFTSGVVVSCGRFDAAGIGTVAELSESEGAGKFERIDVVKVFEMLFGAEIDN